MSNSLFEAFQALETLNEDSFNVTDDGIAKLIEFEDGDAAEEMETIIDPLAETDEDLQASYIGKAILNCIICQSKIYKDPSEITLSEDDSLVNVGEECPYCQSPDGYKVIGQVAEYNPAESEETTDEITDVKIDEEPVEIEEIDADNTSTKTEPIKESIGSYDYIDYNDIPEDLFAKIEAVLPEGCEYDRALMFNNKATAKAAADAIEALNIGIYADVEYSEYSDNYPFILNLSVNDLDILEESVKTREEIVKEEGSYDAMDESIKTKAGVRKARALRKNKNLDEDFNKVDIETDTSKMTMTSDENGKVTVTTEPIENAVEEIPAETITPVSTEVEAEIMDTPVEEPEYQDFEIDEFDETEFDGLGEGYLKRVYENVESYKTTKGSINGNTLKLEGVIKFKSGKEAKTNFVFESKTVTKSGKLKLIGENQQFAKGKKSFTLTGRADGKKLIAEGLTYNYRAKDAKTGASKRLYATVNR